ncbi:arylsulfatase [Pelagicoccus sp. SDUM812005]|uniref:sulfatase family protein n=1 Tax=Pelagicoccus sp. SDUM812005 TaxID=3041257 RepID=UPI00280FA79B|nr:arylsulfatase [Pelagicoccus sp. SDUM812005]MDQ8180273.1 arylsulfatase [Pelagicoccus sp. SDUM812005]
MLAFLFGGSEASAARGGLPNVVLIVAEDLGYGDLGCYGATRVRTPHIDGLAERGRRFTDAHSASAANSPSRYALLTGQYPFRVDLWAPVRNTSGLVIDPETFTIADLFKKKAYATGFVGNWQLGFGAGETDWSKPLRPGPLELGFDSYFGIPVINSVSPFLYVENDRPLGHDPADPLVFIGSKRPDEATPLKPLPPESEVGQRSENAFSGAVEAHESYDDFEQGIRHTEKAVEWIRSQDDGPFFLYFSALNIHHPYTPAERFRGSSEAGVYGDYLHELDWMVGEIVACLEERGQLDDTLIVFTSDNGGMFSKIAQDAYQLGHENNGSLLGYKFGAWEGGHRVPFILSWPGKVEAGSVSEELLCTMDLLATFAAITEQAAPAGDSLNQLPTFLGETREPVRKELVIAARQEEHLSLRKGKWMYIPFQGSGGFRGKQPGQNGFAGPAAASYAGRENSDIENGRIKESAPPGQLYDLERDLSQTTNRYRDYPHRVERMASLLNEYVDASQSP